MADLARYDKSIWRCLRDPTWVSAHVAAAQQYLRGVLPIAYARPGDLRSRIVGRMPFCVRELGAAAICVRVLYGRTLGHEFAHGAQLGLCALGFVPKLGHLWWLGLFLVRRTRAHIFGYTHGNIRERI